MLRLLTTGESHGKCLVGILEGMPHGLEIDPDFTNLELSRRQSGYGRGGRMKIETDEIEILSGVRHGRTIGSPLAFMIRNRDWEHWKVPMSTKAVPGGVDIRYVSRPRPGHADLAGALKYQTHDMRDILERASARETATRVAAGAFCKTLLLHFGIRFGSHVLAIGKQRVAKRYTRLDCERIFSLSGDGLLPCADKDARKRMIALIDEAKKAGDTLGGILEVVATAVPPGLGAHTQWDLRLDGRIAQAMMSIPSAKAVEIGSGVEGAQMSGAALHDEIFYGGQLRRFYRKTNRAGGIEGGITNGADIRVRVYMKPIPTLRKPLMSVDVVTKEKFEAAFERSDTCVVPAAAVVSESMLAIVLAGVFLEKFGGDSIKEIEANFKTYEQLLDGY
jgi:chorismate synthase